MAVHHKLRHSFAFRALALGESLPMIGKLLGHKKIQTTARYAHLARDSVKTAAAMVDASLAADMDTPPRASSANFGSPASEPGDTVPINGMDEARRHHLSF